MLRPWKATWRRRTAAMAPRSWCCCRPHVPQVIQLCFSSRCSGWAFGESLVIVLLPQAQLPPCDTCSPNELGTAIRVVKVHAWVMGASMFLKNNSFLTSRPASAHAFLALTSSVAQSLLLTVLKCSPVGSKKFFGDVRSDRYTLPATIPVQHLAAATIATLNFDRRRHVVFV